MTVNHSRAIPENPPKRRELRRDFPKTFLDVDIARFIFTVRQELMFKGPAPDGKWCVHVAAPRKHPDKFPEHKKLPVDVFVHELNKWTPDIEWKLTRSIVETVHLNRTTRQDSLHALADKQVYEIYGENDTPLPVAPDDRQKPYFVLYDDFIEQGTTIANMTGFIEHNGGYVLGAVAFPVNIAQISTRSKFQQIDLQGEFSDASRNTGRLHELADVFKKSAVSVGKIWSHQTCMEKFERALNGVGNSVFALTDGECRRIKSTVILPKEASNGLSFPDLLKGLKKHAMQP